MRSDDDEEAILGGNYSVLSSDLDVEQPWKVETAFEDMVSLIATYHFLNGRIAILYLVLK
jgi:hypothetical protein